MDAGRPQRVHGENRAERRIDAAREPEHNAWEPVLLHVVTQARNAGEVIGGVPFFNLGERPLLASPASLLAAPFGGDQGLLPGRHLQHELALSIEHEGRPVEHKLVLPTHLIDISKRQPRLVHPGGRNQIALILLVHPIGRAVRHDQQLGPFLGKGAANLLAQMSSQTGTPIESPRNSIGSGKYPGANTRFSSNTP